MGRTYLKGLLLWGEELSTLRKPTAKEIFSECTKGIFKERIAHKVAECGNLIDEETATLFVVGDMVSDLVAVVGKYSKGQEAINNEILARLHDLGAHSHPQEGSKDMPPNNH